MNLEITRRQFLKVTGALVIAFGFPLDTEAQGAPALRTSGGPLPPDQLDSWLIIQNDGTITVMTGKVELGTGVSTSLRQIVADELDFPFEKINWIQGDTANTVDQAPTFGSQTIKRGGTQLRQAAAEAKATLLSLAATQLRAPALCVPFGQPTDARADRELRRRDSWSADRSTGSRRRANTRRPLTI